jgi:hypothetical protein
MTRLLRRAAGPRRLFVPFSVPFPPVSFLDVVTSRDHGLQAATPGFPHASAIQESAHRPRP